MQNRTDQTGLNRTDEYVIVEPNRTDSGEWESVSIGSSSGHFSQAKKLKTTDFSLFFCFFS
jgi:hypothetical protein